MSNSSEVLKDLQAALKAAKSGNKVKLVKAIAAKIEVVKAAENNASDGVQK